MDFTYVCIIIEGIMKKLNLNLFRAQGPRTEQKCERLDENSHTPLIYIQNEKSVLPMDFTCVCIIIRGTIKKDKIEFI